jgi:hypothetical protein
VTEFLSREDERGRTARRGADRSSEAAAGTESIKLEQHTEYTKHKKKKKLMQM